MTSMLRRTCVIITAAIAACLTGTHSRAFTIIFDQPTLGATGDLGVGQLTFNDVGGLSGVDLVVSSGGSSSGNLGHAVFAGSAETGVNVDSLGVVGGSNDATVNGQTLQELSFAFSSEVLIEQIVLQGVGRNDDQMQFINLADNFSSTVDWSFSTLGTEGIAAVSTFDLDGFSPIINANADTGDGNGLDLTNGAGFAQSLVIDFNTSINSDGFVFRADQFGSAAGGVGVRSITFDASQLIPGDVDGDGVVEGVPLTPGGDLTFDGMGMPILGDDLGPIIANFFGPASGRADGDLVAPFGTVDFADFRVWKDNAPALPASVTFARLFGGAIPEPGAMTLASIAAFALAARCRGSHF